MKAGRHRTFDKNIALDKAMEVFWKNGYTGTSLTDLTAAMNINKPSLYAAFGNKEELYKSTLNRYVQKHGTIHAQHLFADNKSLSERIQCYLTSIAEMVTAPNLPGGCFVCISTCEIGGDSLPDDALQTITEINNITATSLTEFFNVENNNGNLRSETSPVVMTNYILSLQFGLAVMARNGAKVEELKDVIKISISNFKM
jgi:AcrR family transcriptional regulator